MISTNPTWSKKNEKKSEKHSFFRNLSVDSSADASADAPAIINISQVKVVVEFEL